MSENQDTPSGGTCPECGYVDGHNVRTCSWVLTGRAKPMAGLSPDAVERLRRLSLDEGICHDC